MINKIIVSNNLEEANQFKESVAKRALKLLKKKECFEDVKNNRFWFILEIKKLFYKLLLID